MHRPLSRPLSSPVARAVGEGVNPGPFSATGAYTAVIGDSIDAFGATSWFEETARLSGQRMRKHVNAGVPGENTTEMLARIDADVVAQSPDVCIIGGPTNDHGDGVAASVTRQNIADMVAALRAAGIVPALRNCPSVNVAGTGAFNTIALRRQAVLDHNAWLTTYCATEGLALFDIFTPTFDGTGLSASYTGDGIHFNAAGCYAAAVYNAARLPGYHNTAARPALATAGSLGLFSNPLFVGDTNADGVANGWTTSGGVAKSIVSNGGSLGIGNAQVFEWDAAGGYLTTSPDATTGFVVGDTVEFSGVVQGFSGGTITIRVRWRDGAAAVLSTTDIVFNWDSQGEEEQTFFLRTVVPVGTARINLYASGTAPAGSYRISRATLRKV